MRNAPSSEKPDVSHQPTIGASPVSSSPRDREPSATQAVTQPPSTPARRAAPPRFAPGIVLANRYRVLRFIAKGGMGEVYEVEDTALRVRLALKTILAAAANEPEVVERFKREILIARKVTHTNVCRIYDLGTHSDPADAGAETLFLTMELLEGETLYHLVQRGSIPVQEALPIVEQLASGLEAAHALGIIHRDFKSPNVIVVPPSSPRRPPRAVITDFGLARWTERTEEMPSSISHTGAFIGTPAYMAPEQLEGKPLTPAADVYALGIVIYEMVTGTRPSEGDTPFSMALKRLTQAPVPPSVYVPGLDPAWEALILACLERDPALRPSAADVVTTLRATSHPTAATPVRSAAPRSPAGAPPPTAFEPTVVAEPVVRRPQRPRRSRRLLLSGIGAAVAAVAALAFVFLRPSTTPTSAAAKSPVRKAVAVLDFRGGSAADTADTAWLSVALAQQMAAQLSVGEALRVLPGDDASQATRDLGLARVESVSAEQAKRLGSRLGADYIVLGTFSLVGEGDGRLVRTETRLMDASSGRELASSTVTGTEQQLAALVRRTAPALRKALGVPEPSPAEALQLEALFPERAEALKSWARGLSSFRAFDPARAAQMLETAVASEPRHPTPHAALALAWKALGFEEKAAEEAARAAAASAALPPRAKLLLEARSAEIRKDWEKAIQACTSLLQVHPDDVEAGLRLADVQIAAGKPRGALVTLAALRQLPKAISSDPQIGVAEARAHYALGDLDKQRQTAGAAAREARARGDRLVTARARILEATVYVSQGDLPKASEAIEEARGLYEAAGDQAGSAKALEQMSAALWRQGDFDGARRVQERALSLYRKAGARLGLARGLANLGTMLCQQGKDAEAEKDYVESLATFRAVGAKAEAAITENNLGVRAVDSGRLGMARRRYGEALALFGELDDRSGTATTLANIGEILVLEGDLAGARKTLDEALAISREVGDKAGAAWTMALLGDVFFAQDDLVVARERYGEAGKLQAEAGDRAGNAETRLRLARLDLLQGHAAEAESAASSSEQVLRAEGAEGRAAAAEALRAEALFSLGRVPQATEALRKARQAGDPAEDLRVRHGVAIAEGRIRGAAEDLQTAASAAGKAGFVLLQLEAELARGEVLARAGRASEARAVLDALESKARAKGLALFARRAASAREAPASARPTPR